MEVQVLSSAFIPEQDPLGHDGKRFPRFNSLAHATPTSLAEPGIRSHLRSLLVLELDLNITADQALAECRQRGLVIRSERELAGRAGSHHWHLGFAGRTGTLELNEWQNRVWVKVHSRRDGGWATAFAHELGNQAKSRRKA